MTKVRHDVLPSPDVNWDRSTIAGGPDRLVVAVLASDDHYLTPTYRIQEFDPVRWRWVRRPEAKGVPQVVPRGLVTTYFRCGPPEDELGNQRCDVVVGRLPDGADRWAVERVSKRREWVHEGTPPSAVGVSGAEAVFNGDLSTGRPLAVSLDGVRRLPRGPVVEGPGILGAHLRRERQVSCILDRRWYEVLGDGQVANGLGPGITYVRWLDLTRPGAQWTKPIRAVVPEGASASVTYGCRRSGPLAYLSPRTYEWRDGGWKVLFETGTPASVSGPAQEVVTAAVPVVDGYRTAPPPGDRAAALAAPPLWFLRTTGFESVPGDRKLKAAYPSPNLVRLGTLVVGLIDAPGGPELRVLRPN